MKTFNNTKVVNRFSTSTKSNSNADETYRSPAAGRRKKQRPEAVSHTHLTLPTILLV